MTSVHHCQGTMLTHHGGLHRSIPRLEHHSPAARHNCAAEPHLVVTVLQRNHPESGSCIAGHIQPISKLPPRHTDEHL